MPFGRPIEHFVTLFNTSYLPAGLSLYRSLCERAGRFRLWVLCMDATVEACLRELGLPEVSVIPLSEVETSPLLSVKPGRSVGEYCWTLTPFVPEFVMARDDSVSRVTYLDADLFFFDDPAILLDEFAASDTHVLITEHAFAPEYARSVKAGIYCVQFMTFRNTPEARGVMRWWQDRCLEWCFNRYEDGKIGDQKYLDDWPVRFPGVVHVLQQKERTLAPWNAAHFLGRPGAPTPVFYHFQGFRVLSERKMRCYLGFRVGAAAEPYYTRYASEMRKSIVLIRARWKMVPTLYDASTLRERVAKCYHMLTGSVAYRRYSLDN
jgi:hypothetical protein